MSNIIIYTTPVCPYCVRAKDLLKRKGRTDYREVDVSKDPQTREEMTQKSGGKRSVPQIFIGDAHIGGCDDLYALDKAGKLDAMLAAGA